LFRHYWILAKLFLTVFATIVLLLQVKLIGYVADVAATTELTSTSLSKPRMELVVHAAGGMMVLLAITALSVFKPWGLTRYGRRKLQERYKAPQQLDRLTPASLGFNIFLAVIVVHVAVFAVLHFTGHNLHHGH
jgi:hypothetical protein